MNASLIANECVDIRVKGKNLVFFVSLILRRPMIMLTGVSFSMCLKIWVLA